MKSFLHGRKTLPVEPMCAPPWGIPTQKLECAPGASRPPSADASSATVEVVKEGDKVVHLAITCTCGERIEIECLYPAGS